jgi:endosialidase-like protein
MQIEQLNPILYKWNPRPAFDASTTYAGLSAQNVQSAIPEAIGQGKDGFLTLQDRPLIAAVVNAIKEIASITGTFKDALVAWLGSATNGIGDFFAKVGHFNEADVGKLCVAKSDGSQFCVTGDQLAAIATADAANTQQPAATGSAPASLERCGHYEH